MAGLRAFCISRAALSSQFMMSIFSPFKMFTTAFTLEPFRPTQAPTGSTEGSFDATAIFVRLPASRAMLFISTMPSLTSATSSSKSFFTISGWVRETKILGPLLVGSTFKM